MLSYGEYRLIEFNKPPVIGNEEEYIKNALENTKLSGDGIYGKMCQEWFEDNLLCKKSLLTPSCTSALELAAILLDIQPGDEVIMPSYTFVSTANAFVLRGAKIIFVDIRQDTMNIDERLIEPAITSKTKAIVVVHYAGVGCEMGYIMNIADKHGLTVIEDAAQGMMSTIDNMPLGTIGHIGAYSFHDTKNYTSGGEGGLLIINDECYVDRAEIIREKGTNRSQFFRGQIDKYTWMDVGSSYLPSELQAAYLWAQLQNVEEINLDRLNSWNKYFSGLEELSLQGFLKLPNIPKNCNHNAHMFYIRLDGLEQRTSFMNYMESKGVATAFHYIPLHSSPAGKKFGVFFGNDRFTTKCSESLVRLPMFYGLDDYDQQKILLEINNFFYRDN